MKPAKIRLINAKGKKPLFYLLLLLATLTGLTSNFIIAGTTAASLHIDSDSIQFVGRHRARHHRRVGGDHLDYVYKVNVQNTGTKAAYNVSAKVSSSQNNAELTESLIKFGEIAAGSTVTSQNEFIVRVPRRVRVDKSALQFAISGQLVNQLPTANAGPDQNVFIGDTAQLDGSASSDTDGDQLQYRWTFISTPQNSHALLTDADTLAPHFTVDLPGTYQVQLIVNDGIADTMAFA